MKKDPSREIERNGFFSLPKDETNIYICHGDPVIEFQGAIWGARCEYRASLLLSVRNFRKELCFLSFFLSQGRENQANVFCFFLVLRQDTKGKQVENKRFVFVLYTAKTSERSFLSQTTHTELKKALQV